MQYSFFGSILTIGAMIGAITSGQIADFIGRKGVRWRILCQDCSYLSIFPAQTFSHNLLSLWVESGHGDVIHDLYSRMVHSLLIFCRISPIFNYNFDIFVYAFLHVLPSGCFNVGIFFPLFWEIFTRIWNWCSLLCGMLLCGASLLGFEIPINMQLKKH